MSKITSAMAVLGVVAGLGVAALPLSSYAAEQRAESNPVTVRAFVNSELAISTNEVDLVDFGTVSVADKETIQTIDVTVSGSVAKYNLGVMDYDQDTNMNWVAADGTTGGGTNDKIPTVTVAEGETGVANIVGGWGFRVENRHAAGATPATDLWKAMPVYGTEGATTNLAQDEDLATITEGEPATVTPGEATTKVQFGINIKGLDLKNGRYEDQVIFVATADA